MNENEYISFEDRNYLSPTVSRDEQLQFVETLRDTMGQKSAQVNADTYALGSQLPSNLGGLSGAEQTFEARYRTPQLNQTAANLRLAAQQSALNTALSNLQNAYKKRYNDAMLNYQKRAATPSASTTPTASDGEVTTEAIAEGSINPDTLLPDGTPNAVVNGPAGTTAMRPEADYAEYTNEAGETVRQYNDGHLEVLRNGQWIRVGGTDSPIITPDSLGGGLLKLPNIISGGLRRP